MGHSINSAPDTRRQHLSCVCGQSMERPSTNDQASPSLLTFHQQLKTFFQATFQWLNDGFSELYRMCIVPLQCCYMLSVTEISANSLIIIIVIITHTHPFNGPLSRNTWVSWYQKCKTNLDFTEARDSEWQWHQLGHMQVCTCLLYTSPSPRD